jgi:P4 family phage/plasmid primase-like protien
MIQGCAGDFQELYYNCFGSGCCDSKPKLLGRLTISAALEQAGGGPFGPKDYQPSSSSKLAASFSDPFLLSTVSKSDFGSALIFSKLFEHDRRVVYDSGRFWTWDGTSWVPSDTEAALLKTSFMFHMGRIKTYWCDLLNRAFDEKSKELTTQRDNALNELQSRASPSTDKTNKDILKSIEKAEKAIIAGFIMEMKKIPEPVWHGAAVESVPIAHRCLTPLKVNLHVRDFASLLNANRDYLNTTCGSIDLRTGELFAHHPSNMLSKEICTLYEGPNYPSPLIDQFMAEVLSEDIVPVMQMTLGYGITGHSKEKQFIVMHGPTNSAKTKLVTMVRESTGPYCVSMARDCVIGAGEHSEGAATPHLLMLDGAHIAVLEETEDSDVHNGASVKAIASGDGSMTVRGLHKDPVEVTMRCLPIICTNSLPKFDARDTGTLNKLRIFPFEHEFVENPRPGTHQRLRDTDLMDKLKTPEWRKQMLAWLVRGSMKWYERGTQLPWHEAS